MIAKEEQVLVISTRVFHAAGPFHGLTRDVDHYLPKLLDPKQGRFMPRALAEEDPSFKQLIPYVVLKFRDQLFHYRRGKGMGEKRLHGLRSVGIGGHINPTDLECGPHAPHEEIVTRSVTPTHPYRQGLEREIAEEIVLDASYRETLFGFINDDSTPVGSVHLGIVHVFELDEPKVQRREVDLMESGFAPIAELAQAKDAFETWSRFVLEELAT